MIFKEVFHYTKASTALGKILLDKQFKIGRFKNTNDPKESKEFLLGSFSGEGLNDFSLEIGALIKR